MSPQKKFFLIAIAVISVLIVGVFTFLSYSKKSDSTYKAPSLLNMWVVNGSTDDYTPLINQFKKAHPEYKKTTFSVKKFASYNEYQNTVLRSLLNETGPDIFMVDGSDAILKDYIESIPDSYIPTLDFEKRYESIFSRLISEGKKKGDPSTILGVPLSYETLGMFYNKDLVRIIPKTWNDVDLLYSNNESPGVIPTNLGLDTRYNVRALDILSLFLAQKKVSGYQNFSETRGADDYLSYARLEVPKGTETPTESEGSDAPTNSTGITLADMRQYMDKNKFTTADLFMQGKIAIYFGFPSDVRELELAKKRAGTSSQIGLILTERIPQEKAGESSMNMARYFIFSVSKKSKYQEDAAKFVSFLTTPEAEGVYIEKFPYEVPAQRAFYENAGISRLSDEFTKTELQSFIPEVRETLQVFEYGIRKDFEDFLYKYIDIDRKIDNTNYAKKLSSQIVCELSRFQKKGNIDSSCENPQ